MSRVEVHASGEEIAFDVEDAHGNQAQFQLGRRLVSMLILRAHEEMRNLPPLPGGLLQEIRPPFLRGYPAMELAIAESGDAVLAFRVGQFPTMEFLITDDLAAVLASDLADIVDTPRHLRFQRNKN
jgi:hypothetical protein